MALWYGTLTFLSVLSLFWDCNKITAKHTKLTWQKHVYKQESLNKQKDTKGAQVPIAYFLQSTYSFRATLRYPYRYALTL
jgi:hypothetical protein